IEIGHIGAYSLALRTRFNGFYPDTFVEVEQPFVASTANAAMPELRPAAHPRRQDTRSESVIPATGEEAHAPDEAQG
ncbi:hypothetical protein, partial [Campylobacter jejuni]|uniref:hypothetical protein n=1 Tax=Campylobacter jejuni TaxID=197 RepID=UPI00211B9CB2